jgi:hypothetical protein
MKKLQPKKAKEVLAKIKECANVGRIDFAPQDRLSENTTLLHDFMEHVIGCTCYWLSDYSSVDEFSGGKRSFKVYRKKILERYGVDVPVGEKGCHYICDVLDHIAKDITII